jgi:glutamate-1-semialdehyde 2,1-aminomutase
LTDPYPVYGRKGVGAKVWDVDGNEYLDFNMGFGALVVGHAHPLIVQAISERISAGTILGLEFEDSIELGRVIQERFNVDMVRFSSTGMEATTNAVRFARAHTGRNKIMKFEGCYHGGNDHILVSVKPKPGREGSAKHPIPVPASLGTPKDTLKNTLVAPFNDLEAVRKIVEENSDDFAGMILEPIPMNMGVILPQRGFLEGLREICDQYNSVLIFDEVKICGKYYGGASERFHVNPDLKCMGKAIGGGFALSAVAGKKEIMEEIVPGVVSHAGTFNSNPLVITAGLVTLARILTKNAMADLAKLGQTLSAGYNDIVKDEALPAIVSSDSLSGALAFAPKPIMNWRDFQKSDIGRWSLYYLMMLNRGIIPAGTGPDEQWTLSVQHTREDIEKHLETFKEIAPALREYQPQMAIVEAI